MVFQESEDEAGAVVGGRAVHDQEVQVDIPQRDGSGFWWRGASDSKLYRARIMSLDISSVITMAASFQVHKHSLVLLSYADAVQLEVPVYTKDGCTALSSTIV